MFIFPLLLIINAVYTGFGVPQFDIAYDEHMQITVDREEGQYLGHPTTVQLSEGNAILCIYPKGHGGGALVMRRSVDGGKTWSERLPVPASWSTSKETPHAFRVKDTTGNERLILFSGLYPIRMSVSEDEGSTWSELAPIGNYGGIVAMSDLVETGSGMYTAFFHDDGRFIGNSGRVTGLFHEYAVDSRDGGLTWSEPRTVAHLPDVHLCEPGIVRSPDGEQLAMLLRENSRTRNSHICFSDDNGLTWTTPVELPDSLTGDRHQAVYTDDGRLFISFRDTGFTSKTAGDWIGWIGTYDDLVRGNEGQYRLRLSDNHHAWDCAYPGVELLPDGTILAVTYGHWAKGEQPFIRGVRLQLDDIESKFQTDARFHCWVLGRAQDGGLPHLGCDKKCCQEARKTGRVEYPACLGIHDTWTDKLVLIEATPAIEAQVTLLQQHAGVSDRGRKPIDALMITHAHIGHYAGLIHVGREVASTQDLPVFVTSRMANFVRTNGPWSQLVKLEQIKLQEITAGTLFEPVEGLTVRAISVPHRGEFSDTVAFQLRGSHRTILFVPDIDRWEENESLLSELLDGVDIAYIDATFYDGSELPGRNLSEIPHPAMISTMALLADVAIDRPGAIRFIHFNHTNPAITDADTARSVEAKGFGIAKQGEMFGF